MTNLEKNGLIVGSIILIALLIWSMLHANATAANSSQPIPPVIPAGSPTFVINTQPDVFGPVTFPPSVFNFPQLQAPGTLQSGNCSCGCNGSTTFDFNLGPSNQILTQLEATASAADNAILQAIIQSMGYGQSLFVGNATPTPWAGGNFSS